ncbi:BF3164 family lipoprotein [Flavobacteriaceae bacterium 14752]|uniref:BF3164 family lipoprotein n=1 Tax=Mesohalobacter salilacus TaxID=2491711 RepID=UPI000F636178|nr:hypothetical protein EIG84_08895 [Flavobacteriaceae bacterium 14752]
MKVRIIYLNIVFFAFISCDKTDENIIRHNKNSFFISKNLNGEVVPLKDFNLNKTITVFDTLIILGKSPFQTKKGSAFFNVYHKTKYNFLGSIGVKGDGPWHNEWSEIHHNQQISISNANQFLWLYNYNNGFVAKLNLSKTIESKSSKPVIDTTILVNAKKFPYLSLNITNDNLIATPWLNETPQSLIKKIDLENNSLKKIKLSPTIKNSNILPSEILNSLYSSSIKVNQQTGKIAQAMYIFDRINIYDNNLNREISIVDGENWVDNYYDAKEIDIKSNFIKDKVNGYSRLTVSNNFIFALKSTYNSSQKNISEVRVYDWRGKPLFFLTINNPVLDFSFDEKTKTLYALDHINDLILKYGLNEIIRKWQNN